ncbi:hypothetical protein C8R45DRAFT_934203 [Mycena sanguinolenta]|nr:hypothetical protein C8R45DRAFT_934203 [Mycena sanguinolenta]
MPPVDHPQEACGTPGALLVACHEPVLTGGFVVLLGEDYWWLFDWRLSLDEEPSGTATDTTAGNTNVDAVPNNDVEEAFNALDLNLTEEEEDRKAKVMKDTKQVVWTSTPWQYSIVRFPGYPL